MKWYIIGLIALVALYMLVEYSRPRTIDWTPTFNSHDKIPYGTWIVFNELKHFFGGELPKEQLLPVYDHVNNSVAEDELYLLINGSLGTTETDEDELYHYIERGNTVFIATESLGKSFTKKFHVDINWYVSLLGDDKHDSATINFTNPRLKARKNYSLERGALEGYFSKVDTGNTTILGVNSYGNANFIRVKIGSGNLYLHSAPKVFSNYFALKDNNIEYINKVFSELPAKPSAVYWDEYYTTQTEAESEMHVVLARGDLNWAYYIALAAMLLYVLFQLKRRQRIIPIVAPPKNDSREFVETVSRVYFNQKHHHNIAEKKISHWMDFVRSRFGISTKEISDEFVQQLSHRSGIALSEIREIANQVSICRVRPELSTDELLYLNQLIDNFYKQAR